MADNYLQFSFGIPLKTDEEVEWVERQLDDVRAVVNEDGGYKIFPKDAPEGEILEWAEGLEGSLQREGPRFLVEKSLTDEGPPISYEDGTLMQGFEATVYMDDTPRMCLYAEENGDPMSAALFCQAYLEKFDPAGHIAFSWAETCSKPRFDAFGGGAVVVQANRMIWMNTCTWIEAEKKELSNVGGA